MGEWCVCVCKERRQLTLEPSKISNWFDMIFQEKKKKKYVAAQKQRRKRCAMVVKKRPFEVVVVDQLLVSSLLAQGHLRST